MGSLQEQPVFLTAETSQYPSPPCLLVVVVFVLLWLGFGLGGAESQYVVLAGLRLTV